MIIILWRLRYNYYYKYREQGALGKSCIDGFDKLDPVEERGNEVPLFSGLLDEMDEGGELSWRRMRHKKYIVEEIVVLLLYMDIIMCYCSGGFTKWVACSVMVARVLGCPPRFGYILGA